MSRSNTMAGPPSLATEQRLYAGQRVSADKRLVWDQLHFWASIHVVSLDRERVQLSSAVDPGYSC